MTRKSGHPWIGAAAAIWAALFVLGLVYVFPPLFRAYIEPQDPSHYEATVPEALARGHAVQAVRMARIAADRYRTDPGPETMHGRALLAVGDTTAAQAAFERAVAVNKTPAPAYRPTRKPFFHAEARMALAELAMDAGDEALALHHLELARGYGMPDSLPPSKIAFNRYTARQAWHRALTFARPAVAELGYFDTDSLTGLGEAAAVRGAWEYAEGLARTAVDRGGANSPRTALLMGRILAHRGELGEGGEWLGRAAEAGHPAARFYLGLVEEALGNVTAARDYWRDTPEGAYRLFAVAKFMSLDSEDWDDSAIERLLEMADQFDWIALEHGPRTYTEDGIVASRISLPEHEIHRGDVFPAVIHWRRDSAAAERRVHIRTTIDGASVLELGESVYQLDWLVNSAPLLAGLRDDGGLIGWIDPEVDWDVGANSAALYEVGMEGEVCLRAERDVRVLGPPLAVGADEAYVLLSFVTDGGSVTWEFLTPMEEIDGAYRLNLMSAAGSSAWIGAYTRGIWSWEAVRVVLQMEAGRNVCIEPIILSRLRNPISRGDTPAEVRER